MYHILATVDACHELGSCMLNKNVLSPYLVKPKIAVKIKRGNQELKYNAVLSHLRRESVPLKPASKRATNNNRLGLGGD